MPNPSVSCKHEGCEKPSDGGKGYCARHYAAWKRGRLPKARYKSCRIEGCRKPVTGRGRCAEHFARDYPGKQAAATGETPTPAPAT
ncbi:MAG: vegetative protein [Deltaproteobacteria bacterium]|nr:MAG: vegetative protein [Deltaproteobacteria bacterium]